MKKKEPYRSTTIYRDASKFLQEFTKRAKDMQKVVQYTIGEMGIRDAMRLVQLMRLAYTATDENKFKFFEEADEKVSCLQVIVNELYEGHYIQLKSYTLLYETLGSIISQLKAWETSQLNKLTKEENAEKVDEIDKEE